MKIRSLDGILSTDVPTGNLLWVDAVNGVDGAAVRGRLTIPFRTLVAAKTAAKSGDTIMVLPGTYTEKGLAVNGVNWHFFNGAKVQWFSSDAVFEVTSAMTFKVTGEGEFITGANRVLKVANSSSDITFKCLKMTGTEICVEVTLAAKVVLEAYSIFGDDGPAVSISGGTVELSAFSILSQYGQGLYFSGGTATLRAFEIRSQNEHAVNYNSSGNGKLTIVDARLVTQDVSGDYKAVYISSGSPTGSPATLKLVRCVLVVGGGSTTIDGASGRAVGFYGECVGNYNVNTTNVTPQVSTPLTFTTNVT